MKGRLLLVFLILLISVSSVFGLRATIFWEDYDNGGCCDLLRPEEKILEIAPGSVVYFEGGTTDPDGPASNFADRQKDLPKYRFPFSSEQAFGENRFDIIYTNGGRTAIVRPKANNYISNGPSGRPFCVGNSCDTPSYTSVGYITYTPCSCPPENPCCDDSCNVRSNYRDIECRPAAGVCDEPEFCSFTGTCPIDREKSGSTVCRPSAGICDVAETCTGSTVDCPADGFKGSAITCRNAVNICDNTERCTGSSAACPANSYASPTTVARASAGVCDQEEYCSGFNAIIPPDAKQPSGYECRVGGACNPAEQCDGSSSSCPADVTGTNGIVEAGEACDDGNSNNGDGCTSTCQVSAGWSCVGSPSVCTLNVVCGNGVTQAGEQCDDGNTANGDGCSSTCQTEVSVCGNSIVEFDETCDDGNAVGGDGCDATCQTEVSVCGNSIVEFDETCDDGNTVAFDGCSPTCQTEIPVCGNGATESGEQCDDGNTADGDGCNSLCQFETISNPGCLEVTFTNQGLDFGTGEMAGEIHITNTGAAPLTLSEDYWAGFSIIDGDGATGNFATDTSGTRPFTRLALGYDAYELVGTSGTTINPGETFIAPGLGSYFDVGNAIIPGEPHVGTLFDSSENVVSFDNCVAVSSCYDPNIEVPVEFEQLSLRNDPNLVAYWRMEGNANDELGNHDGTPVNNVVPIGAKFGQGYDFQTTDAYEDRNYISVPDHPDFDLDEFSFSLWARSDDFNIPSRAAKPSNPPALRGSQRPAYDHHITLIAKGETLGGVHTQFEMYLETQQREGYFPKAVVCQIDVDDGSDADISYGGWYLMPSNELAGMSHYGCTFDGSQFQIYFNGEKVFTQNFYEQGGMYNDGKIDEELLVALGIKGSAIENEKFHAAGVPGGAVKNYNDAELTIGSKFHVDYNGNVNMNNSWDGVIDDVAIFDRVLTDDEMAIIGKGLTGHLPICEPVSEACNGRDDDGDGLVDENVCTCFGGGCNINSCYSDLDQPLEFYSLGISDADLIAYYPLDNDGNDFKGVEPEYNGTAYNGVVFNPTGGIIGGAAEFDGISESYIDLSNHLVEFTGYPEGTFAGWFKSNPTSTIAPRHGYTLWKMFGPRYSQNNFMVKRTGAHIGHVDGSYTDDSAQFYFRNHSSEILDLNVPFGIDHLNDDQWHHIAFVIGDGDNRIYIDGHRVASDNFRGPLDYTSQFFTNIGYINSRSDLGWRDLNFMRLGNWQEKPGMEFFRGSMDEFLIFGRTLSDEEVAKLAKGPNGDLPLCQPSACYAPADQVSGIYSVLSPVQNNLVAYWPFEIESIQSAEREYALDYKGNAHGRQVGKDIYLATDGSGDNQMVQGTWPRYHPSTSPNLITSGKVGGAAEFTQGNEGYYDLKWHPADPARISAGNDYDAVPQIEGRNSGTITGWFKTTKNDNQTVFYMSDNTEDNFVKLELGKASKNPISFTVQREGNAVELNLQGDVCVDIQDDDWHHFAIVIDGVDNKIYLDGYEYPTIGDLAVSEFTDITGGIEMRIGSEVIADQNGSYFEGLLDELAIYDTALDSCDIEKLARGTTGCLSWCGVDPGLICDFLGPVCGNNLLEAGETCDDGNILSGDGCDSLCQVEISVCGNSIVEFDETCDDGNTADGDGCSSSCQTETSVDLICTATTSDLDSDSTTLSYEWFRVELDGSLTSISSNQQITLLSSELKQHVYMCEVIANDGTDDSLKGRQTYTLSNDHYIPYGQLNITVDKLGPYSRVETIPETVIVGTDENVSYNTLVECIQGECGDLDSSVVYSVLYLSPIRPEIGLDFPVGIFGSETILGTSNHLSDSPLVYRTNITSNYASIYSEVMPTDAFNYTLQGTGELPFDFPNTTLYDSNYQAECLTRAYVNYDNGSRMQVVDDILYESGVLNIELETEIQVNLPFGTFIVPATSETIYSSGAHLRNCATTNCFTHDFGTFNYPLFTSISAQVDPTTLIEDPVLRSQIEPDCGTWDVEINPTAPVAILFDPEYEMCLEHFDNLPLPIYVTLLNYDGSAQSLYPGVGTLKVDLDTTEFESLGGDGALLRNMIDLDVISTTNYLGQTVVGVELVPTPSFNQVAFDNLFAGPNANYTINFNGTYSIGQLKVRGSSYFEVDNSCSDTQKECVYYYSGGGKRFYYWRDLADGEVEVFEKCDADIFGTQVNIDRLDLDYIENSNPGGLQFNERLPNGECSNFGTTGDTTCYEVQENGFYNLSITVNDTVIPYLPIEVNGMCSFRDIEVNDPHYLLNRGVDKYELLSGNSFDVENISVICSVGARIVEPVRESILQGDSITCREQTGQEIFEDPLLDMTIVSDDPASLSYNDYTATVNMCNLGIVGSNFTLDGSGESFCITTQDDDPDLYLPDAHFRNTLCTSDLVGAPKDELRDIRIANHVAHTVFATSQEFKVDTEDSAVRLVNTILEDSSVVNFLQNDLIGSDGNIGPNAYEPGTSNADFDRNIAGHANVRGHNYLPQPDSQTVKSYLSFYELKRAWVESSNENFNKANEEFLNESRDVLNLDITNICSNAIGTVGNVPIEVRDDCENLVLSLIFDPGFYLDETTGEIEFCYVDLDWNDQACCAERTDCVYDGVCIPEGEPMPQSSVDEDYVPEVCGG